MGGSPPVGPSTPPPMDGDVGSNGDGRSTPSDAPKGTNIDIGCLSNGSLPNGTHFPPTPNSYGRSPMSSPCQPSARHARVEDDDRENDGDNAGSAARKTVPDANFTTGNRSVDAEPTTSFPHRRSRTYPVRPLGPHESEAGGPHSRAYARVSSYVDAEARLAGRAFPRISRPVELLRSSYDVVVIGSGYGGSIAASRMARAGESVCLLERGRERWPGEYPTSTVEALRQLHVSGEFAPHFLPGMTADGGDPTGMFHLVLGRGQNAVVGNGLGGTSLINANVFLRADADTMAMPAWPPELREPGELDRYYDKVEAVLEPERYPEDWPTLPKLELLRQQAEHLGMADRFSRVPQTTRFRNGPNSCGVEMSPSALTGQDCTGLNDGSKTTTLVTYLADAWNWGAEMFCECEVRHVEKVRDARGGYLVFFAWHGRNRGHFKANLHGDLMWVHARRAVFLGAGAIGTTEILLRSRAMGLAMSDQVGQNMSGNGDILAFGYNTDESVNAIGRPFPSPYRPVGPCISGVIDNRAGHDNPLDGFVIEEGTVPAALARLFHAMLELTPGSSPPPEGDTLVERAQAALAKWGSRLFGPYFSRGAIERTQIYLVMSHDSNQAVLTLEDDRPVLEFLGVGRSGHVAYLNGLLARATQAAGGTLVQNPFFALLGEQQVTVHPIGGASMARDNTGATGVTNHKGEVFSGDGPETHRGLIVVDGALVPTALGVNPFATIAALAERCVAEYARDNALLVRTDRNGILDLFDRPRHRPLDRVAADVVHDFEIMRAMEPGRVSPGLGLFCRRTPTMDEIDSIDAAAHAITKAEAVRASGFGFTEVMSGFLHNDAGLRDDTREAYELAYRSAEALCESARFFLSVQAFNTKSLVTDPEHRGMLTGTFVCPTIPGSPFMVKRGNFGLFLVDHKAPGTRNLMYDFDMKGVNGDVLHFHGYKVVDSSVALAPLQFWRSTSTLYVTITNPRATASHEDGGGLGHRQAVVVARGIMHIRPKDFASEVLTMTPTGSSLLCKALSAASFLTYFARKSMSLFLAPLTPLQYPTQSYSGYINDTPPTRSFAIRASDGVFTRMHMWDATSTPLEPDGCPLPARNLFMIPGAAVDHQIFALPTIPFNAINYFTRAGYRVFVSVHRIGQIMVAENSWTTYDARRDLRACLEYIRQHFPDSDDDGLDPDPAEGKVLSPVSRVLPVRPSKIYTIAHCMGSVALASGLLDGTIPAHWISGVTCSQVFMNPLWNTGNMAKLHLGPLPADRLYSLMEGNWFSCSTSPHDSWLQQAVNQMLRFYPDERRELCNSASCHRTTLVFGRCWNHRNLNEATHRQIDRFFGGVNMRLLNLLMRMGGHGHVMANAPLYDVLTTRDNVERLRGLPFLLFVGRDNAVLSPEATERTYETLCGQFTTRSASSSSADNGSPSPSPGSARRHTAFAASPAAEYRRRVVPGYGHLDCWMGRNAWKDIYPFVREEVDRVVRGESYRFVEPEDRFKHMVENGELVH